MSTSSVVVINDYAVAGGAEVVYQQSIDVLSALPNVDVACFDLQRAGLSESVRTKTWNVPAAAALAHMLETHRPDRVLVHNYHNALSPAVLRVLLKYKRQLGFSAFLTCHDFYSVYYNSALMQYIHGEITIFPIDRLNSMHAALSRSSASGPAYDTFKKIHWHVTRMLGNPSTLFDAYFCPSPFMQQALTHYGYRNAVLLPNPSPNDLAPVRPKCVQRAALSLAFVGRIVPEKGLGQLLALASAMDFDFIEDITVYGTGPDLAQLEQTYARLIESGKLRFRGVVPHDALLASLREHVDALILPSVGAENAPLVVVEAAMLGLPILVRDIGSLATFGDEIGNKIKFSSTPDSLRQALADTIAHLSDATREYDVTAYSVPYYAKRLVQLMRIGETEAREASALAPA